MTREEIMEALENNVLELIRNECEKALGTPLTRSDIVARKKIDPVLQEHFDEIMKDCIDKLESEGTMEQMMADSFHMVGKADDDVQS